MSRDSTPLGTIPAVSTSLDARSAPVLTIDGPTASGKGTIAQEVARALGWHYLDSGALYRLTALAALRGRIPLDDPERLAQAAAALPVGFGPMVRSLWAATTSPTRSASKRLAAAPLDWRSTPAYAPRCSVYSAGSGGRRGWSPTVATWARWCSRTPRSRCS
jgi:hypothetical protein